MTVGLGREPQAASGVDAFSAGRGRLGGLPGWSRKGDTITKTFSFTGYPEAVAFVQRTVRPAEELNHHPDIDVRYNRVIVTLSTHDSGGVTENDLLLAAALDSPPR